MAGGRRRFTETAFVGRRDELDGLVRTLAAHRLVTLTGPGGSGKTRLATEVLAGQAPTEGAAPPAFIELAPVGPEGVGTALALAVGATAHAGRGADDPVARAVAHLGESGRLLVFDNCEHVVDRVAAVIDDLLAACPGVRVLATSREPLRLLGEAIHPLAPMTTDDAVELFRQRASLTGVDLSATTTLATLCARLDRLPLAIELAAAQCRWMSVADLDAGLRDRFALLVSRRRDVPDRHRTMRETIAWSVDRLTDDQRCLLAQLSVLAGTFDAATASDITGAGASELADLVDRSLLAVRTDDPTAPSRFWLLDSVRDYARELLANEDPPVAADTHARLARWALRRSAIAGELEGRGEEGALAQLDLDEANLRAALDHCTDVDRRRLATALTPYWLRRAQLRTGRRELRRALETASAEQPGLDVVDATLALGELALAQSDVDEAEHLFRSMLDQRRLPAVTGLGRVARLRGNYDEAATWLEEGLTAAEAAFDQRYAALCLLELGQLASLRGDAQVAEDRLRASLTARRSLGDRRGVVACLLTLGKVAESGGRFDTAAGLYEEALGAATKLDDVSSMATALARLGDLSFRRQGGISDYTEAEGLYTESLHLWRRLGDRRGEASALAGLGNLCYRQGLFDAAREHYQASLSIRRALDDRRGAAALLVSLANIASMNGDTPTGWALGEEALAEQRAMGSPKAVWGTLLVLVEIARDSGDTSAAEAFALEALDIATAAGDERDATTARCMLGQLAAAAGDLDTTADFCRQALADAERLGERHVLARTIEVVAGLTAASDAATATTLFGAAEELRGSELFRAWIRPSLADAYREAVERCRSALGADAFETRWLSARALSTADSAELALAVLDRAVPDPARASWQQTGAGWAIAYDGDRAELPDRKGFTYLARLLAAPGTEISAADLVAADGAWVDQPGLESLDVATLGDYRRHLADLHAEADQAREWNDIEAAARSDAEIDALQRELANAAGRGSRPRRTGGNDERARKAATKCIREAIDQLRESLPELASHLDHAVRTGAWCRYCPEHPQEWVVARG